MKTARRAKGSPASLRRIIGGAVLIGLLMLAVNILSGRTGDSSSGGGAENGIVESRAETGLEVGAESRALQEVEGGESGPADEFSPDVGDGADGAPAGGTTALADLGEAGVGEEGPASGGGDAAESDAAAGGEGEEAGTMETAETIAGGSGGEDETSFISGGEGVMPDLGKSVVKVALSLAVVIALAFAARFFLKKVGGGRRVGKGEGHVEVIGYTRLGSNRGIYEVRMGNRIWFIGDGEKGLQLLGEMDPEDPGEEYASWEGEDAEEDDVFRALLDEDVERVSGGDYLVPRSWLDALRWRTARK